MRGKLSPQNTSTGADSRPKMPGKAHRMAICKNGEMVSDHICSHTICSHLIPLHMERWGQNDPTPLLTAPLRNSHD